MKKKATVICWISTALAALALCLTCGLPLPAGIPPMLLQWLILPLLALLTAAVQAGRPFFFSRCFRYLSGNIFQNKIKARYFRLRFFSPLLPEKTGISEPAR